MNCGCHTVPCIKLLHLMLLQSIRLKINTNRVLILFSFLDVSQEERAKSVSLHPYKRLNRLVRVQYTLPSPIACERWLCLAKTATIENRNTVYLNSASLEAYLLFQSSGSQPIFLWLTEPLIQGAFDFYCTQSHSMSKSNL